MRPSPRPPFPGMDPWLEQPALWPDVHTRLIVAIGDALGALIDPAYVVRVEERAVFLGGGVKEMDARPDVTIARARGEREHVVAGPGLGGEAQADADAGVLVLELPPVVCDDPTETFLEIRDALSHRVVTVVEILSPVNKQDVRARRQYERKRAALRRAEVSLVEIDLLRAGEPMRITSPMPASDYRILVERARPLRRSSHLYTFSCRAAIPTVPVPLGPADDEPSLPLNTLLHDVCDRARYFRSIDYARPPVPPLRPEDAAWAAEILARATVPDPA